MLKCSFCICCLTLNVYNLLHITADINIAYGCGTKCPFEYLETVMFKIKFKIYFILHRLK